MTFADKFFQLSTFLSENIIARLYLPILVLIILKIISKNKTDITLPLKFIKWIIISYCIITLLSWLLVSILPVNGSYAFIDRATGPYAWAYWLMLICNCLLPFVLLNKRIGANFYWVFIVSLVMNIGWIFEQFVIIITSIHRDYL